MSAGSNERDIQAYEAAYSSDYDFELVQVKYRREAVLRSLHARKPSHVVEIGCGLEPLLPHYIASGGAGIARWVVAEPSDRFAQAARTVAEDRPEMVVRQGFFEDLAERIVEESGQADMVICSGLLHEVPDQMRLLRAISMVMRPEALLHVNVPNAGSLHRQLAKAMGLIGDLRQMSARNIQLQQHRVYSLDTLRADLDAVGLRSTRHGGILLKPFTHGQMQAVIASVGDHILPGLGKLGEEFPELASEIFVDACLADG